MPSLILESEQRDKVIVSMTVARDTLRNPDASQQERETAATDLGPQMDALNNLSEDDD